MFKVNKRNTRKMCKIYSKLTIKATSMTFSGVFNANLKHISHLFYGISIVKYIIVFCLKAPFGAFSE